MRISGVLIAGLCGAGWLVACSGAPDAREPVSFVPGAPTMTNPASASSAHAAPPELEAAGAPAPLQPTAAAATAAASSTPSVPAAPAPSMAASTPAGAPATPATAAPAAPVNGFNAGSGMLQTDGKTVVYHIPDGTGGKDWNPKDKPIRVERGMTVRLIDDDKSTRSGGHWLHTNGQPCPHGLKAIGTGFDCAISRNAPLGVVSGTFEHNVANGIGRLYIEVVETKAPAAD